MVLTQLPVDTHCFAVYENGGNGKILSEQCSQYSQTHSLCRPSNMSMALASLAQAQLSIRQKDYYDMQKSVNFGIKYLSTYLLYQQADCTNNPTYPKCTPFEQVLIEAFWL